MTAYSLDLFLSQFGTSLLFHVCCSNCCCLSCIQISQEAGKVVWYSHLLKNFPQFVVIPTVKGFGIVNKAEVDVFLDLSCFFNDPTDVGNLISCSSAFSKSSLNIWKFLVLLEPGLENFQYYFAAAAAKSNRLCPTLCDPIDGSLPGSTVHGIFQARVLEWVAIAFSDYFASM